MSAIHPGLSSQRDRFLYSKVLQYVSCMMLFRSLASRNLEREVLLEKLSAIPSIVAESLLSRFTETARGSFQ